MRNSNKLFSAFFLILAIASVVGFIIGYNHCFFVALLTFGLSYLFRVAAMQKT